VIAISDKLPKVYLAVSIVFGVIALYFLFHIGFWYWSAYRSDAISKSLQSNVTDGSKLENPIDADVKRKDEELTDISTPEDFPFVSVDFEPLKERNSDIVAWLRYEGVGIDLPVVQTTDNEFYLSHDVDKKPSKLGWVFADTRSNVNFPGLNTVLYGHNATRDRMFGSLKTLLSVTEENKDAYKYVSLTTETKEMVYEVVSVYVTDYTDWTYVNHTFFSLEEKQAFIDMLISRNVVKIFSNKSITPMDNILTFSTCYGPAGTTDRLVVHAKLIATRSM